MQAMNPAVNKVSLNGLLGVPSEVMKKRGLGSQPMSPKSLKRLKDPYQLMNDGQAAANSN